MLRNVGRSSVPHTNYIFVVDVDMMCNGNLYSSFLVLAHRLNLFANSIGKEFILFIALIFQEQIGHDILGKENAITETKLFFFFFQIKEYLLCLHLKVCENFHLHCQRKNYLTSGTLELCSHFTIKHVGSAKNI